MMKKRNIIILAIASIVVMCISAIILCMYAPRFSFEYLNGDGIVWLREEERSAKVFSKGSGSAWSLVNIDAVKAAEIADLYLCKVTDRHYNVWFDEENSLYFVWAKYAIHDGKYRPFIDTEDACSILIDSNTGAVLDITYDFY